MSLKIHNSTTGFTIVELLVVILILGILVTITSFTFTSVRDQTIMTTLNDDLKRGSNAIESYKSNNGKYPTALTDLNNGKGITATGSNIYRYVEVPTYQYCLEAKTSSGSFLYSYDSLTDKIQKSVACP